MKQNSIQGKFGTFASLLLGLVFVALVAFLASARPDQPAAGRPEPEWPASPASSSSIRAAATAPAIGASAPVALNPTPADQVLQISLPESVTLAASFDDIGPQLLEVGAIDSDRFAQVLARAGRPLTEAQQAILSAGSDAPITVDHHNAHFLLNFFWALGLANRNPILESGPLVQQSQGDISRYASTGGWTLGRRPATELYASKTIISLTQEQQARLEEVAAGVYRPCCNNHTAFADCNHGMAMLGLLELMAGQGASVEEMFAAARDANSFWFPQQALETAVFSQVALKQAYSELDPRVAVGRELFSATGFGAVHQWLADNGLLEQAPSSGGSCGV